MKSYTSSQNKRRPIRASVTSAKQNQNFIVVTLLFHAAGYCSIQSYYRICSVWQNKLTEKNDYNFNSAADPRIKKTCDICFVTS